MKLVYVLGLKSLSKIYDIDDMSFLDKQFSIRVPLITSVKLLYNGKLFKNIYVGKEMNLYTLINNKYYIDKYELDNEELLLMSLKGYKKVCLLNYNRFESKMIGLNQDDIVVSDYYALRTKLTNIS